MSRDIVVYGHPLSDTDPEAFKNPGEFIDYIQRGVFEDNARRYRFSQSKSADVIVLSADGKIYGHFKIEAAVPVTSLDKDEWRPTRGVYLVEKSFTYEHSVTLAEIGISRIQFGKKLSEAAFTGLLEHAGRLKEWG